jgi:hypothetical protein
MLTGTWPVAPLVIAATTELTFPEEANFRGATLGSYSLVEGHHRLGYLRALAENQKWPGASNHDLWLVKLTIKP